ncbi:MAG: ribonuclease J [Bacillota bacterium]
MTSDRNAGGGHVRLIPLGGMAEIGKTLLVWESEDEAIVIDSGLAFPEEEMLGVDIVIPDFSYLLEIRDKVVGIFLTHGHEDHIGSLPFLLKEITVPVYGPGLALGLVRQKLEEAGLRLPAGSRKLVPREKVETKDFEVECFRVSHSIADAMGFAVHTPAGLMVHSGDFKFDQTPADGAITDFYSLASFGERGVRCLICDSTNAELEGYTGSERLVGERLEEIFRDAPGRIMVATFASNIPRLQQVIDVAQRFGRRVAVMGRSMENSVEVSLEMGYLEAPEGVLVDVETARSVPDEDIAIITTGTQGEPMSALTRMSRGDDRRIKIREGDTVVIAANPVPGNEKLVYRTVDNLSRLGARVIYGGRSGVHVSGHGSREDIKLMVNLTKPEYAIPIHGEYRHMMAFADLARSLKYDDDKILMVENGDMVEFSPDRVQISGPVGSRDMLVDGLGVGDVGRMVLRDREQLSQDGIVSVVLGIDEKSGKVVSGPEITSRGFVYIRESEDLLEETRDSVIRWLERCDYQIDDRNQAKRNLSKSLSSFIYEKLHRRPMIVPVILEISRDGS